jgi:uncharacterized protein YhfF/DNA-binding CsgD family transcriptional regulator
MRSADTEIFWERYARHAAIGHGAYDVASLSLPEAEEAEALALVEAGVKRAIAAPLGFFTKRVGEPMPRRDGFVVLLDNRRRPRVIWRSTEVEVGPLEQVGAAFAGRSAVGDGSPEWFAREAAEAFRSHAPRWGIQLDRVVETVFETFEVVWPLRTARRAQVAAQHLERVAIAQQRLRIEGRLVTLDVLGGAAMVVDVASRLRQTNEEAEAILSAGDGLCLAGGRLVARSARGRATLETAVAGVAHGRPSGRSRAILVERAEPHPPWQVRILPLPNGMPGALVLVDPSRPPSFDAVAAEMAGTLFGLTAAERRLATFLAEGASPAEAARTLDLRMPTVRAQLRALLAKTETASQAALLRRLDLLATARVRQG